MSGLGYPTLVWVHMLLFVLWLGADVGVFLLGQHFRKRQLYSLDQRLALLKMLVLVDMTPRSAWALMVPVSITLSWAGSWWAVPDWLVWASWAMGAFWLWLVWDAHVHDQTPRAARNRRIENGLKYALTAFYFWLGVQSLAANWPIEPDWLAWKAALFGLIFAAAIMIDLAFKPVGPLLGTLIREGSTDATELPLLKAMNRTRIWVWCVYLLLLATSWLGVTKPF